MIAWNKIGQGPFAARSFAGPVVELLDPVIALVAVVVVELSRLELVAHCAVHSVACTPQMASCIAGSS